MSKIHTTDVTPHSPLWEGGRALFAHQIVVFLYNKIRERWRERERVSQLVDGRASGWRCVEQMGKSWQLRVGEGTLLTNRTSRDCEIEGTVIRLKATDRITHEPWIMKINKLFGEPDIKYCIVRWILKRKLTSELRNRVNLQTVLQN